MRNVKIKILIFNILTFPLTWTQRHMLVWFPMGIDTINLQATKHHSQIACITYKIMFHFTALLNVLNHIYSKTDEHIIPYSWNNALKISSIIREKLWIICNREIISKVLSFVILYTVECKACLWCISLLKFSTPCSFRCWLWWQVDK